MLRDSVFKMKKKKSGGDQKRNKKTLLKKTGVFPKIFAYTMLLVLLICTAAVFLFSREFISFYRAEQNRRLTTSFQPIITTIQSVTTDREDIIIAAERFADDNKSFRFLIQEFDDNILFSTHNITGSFDEDKLESINIRFSGSFRDIEGTQSNQYRLIGYNYISEGIDYSDLTRRIMLALAVMLVIAVLGAVVFAKRITKPLEDEIVRRRILEENQRLFFAAASHELKTPIASARALVEGMMAGVGDYKNHPKYLHECLNTLDTQGRLVSEILDIVKLSDYDTELTQEKINLESLGNSVLNEYRPLAENKNVLIRGEFPDIDVSADKILLRKVFSNIIANAVQNTKENEEIIIKTEKCKKTRGERLCIINTGVHIPFDILTRLFEPFYRQDAARTPSGQSGLGLAIVKKALDRMNLKFALENTEESVLRETALEAPAAKLPAVLFWIELPL